VLVLSLTDHVCQSSCILVILVDVFSFALFVCEYSDNRGQGQHIDSGVKDMGRDPGDGDTAREFDDSPINPQHCMNDRIGGAAGVLDNSFTRSFPL
jgi:hypothetical protein